MKKQQLFLVLILFIAAALRFYTIGTVPASPDWDEVSLGYNAYSLMQTGRDEYGKLLPFIFRSFEDYKPPLYSYFAIPSIAVLGLNTIAVRLPAVLFGVLSVFGMYLLVKELFAQFVISTKRSFVEKDSSTSLRFAQNDIDYLSLLAAVLLAISPWHIQLSRVAFESGVALCFILFAVYFFLRGLTKPWFLLLSVIMFASNIYLYQSQKLFSPLLLFLLVALYFKQIITLPKKYLLTPVLVGALIVLPILGYSILRQEALSRATSTSIFSHELLPEYNSTIRTIWDTQRNDTFGLLLDAKPGAYFKELLNGYLAHFDLNWLFMLGDNERHHVPGMGLLYLWELPFLLVGLYWFFFHFPWGKRKLLILGWLLLAPIPASLTVEVPHAVRTLQLLPILIIFISCGLLASYHFVMHVSRSRRIVYPIFGLFTFVVVGNFVYYLNQYFVQQNYFYAGSWQYGYEQLVAEVQKRENDYDQVVVSNVEYLDQSHMFFLFYMKYPPEKYQAENKLYGITDPHRKMGKYVFRPIDWGKDVHQTKTLYVGQRSEFSDAVKPLWTLSTPSGEEVMVIVEGNK